MKILIILISYVYYPTITFCQLTGIGVNAGGTLSNFNYPNESGMTLDSENGHKTGPTGGIEFDFDLRTEALKFSLELFAIRNGSKEYYNSASTLYNDLASSVNLDYIGLYIPFTLFISLNLEDDKTFNGIYFRVKGFADYSINANIAASNSGESKVEFEDDPNKIDFGIGSEAGFVFNGIKFMFGYNLGIKNIEFSSSAASAISANDNYLVYN